MRFRGIARVSWANVEPRRNRARPWMSFLPFFLSASDQVPACFQSTWHHGISSPSMAHASDRRASGRCLGEWRVEPRCGGCRRGWTLRSSSRGFRIVNLRALEMGQLIDSGWASRGSAAGGCGESWHGSRFLRLDRELAERVTPLPPSDKPTLFSRIQQDSAGFKESHEPWGDQRAVFGLGPGWAQTPVVSSLRSAAWKPGTGPSILRQRIDSAGSASLRLECNPWPSAEAVAQ
jgi:hypothetical protein